MYKGLFLEEAIFFGLVPLFFFFLIVENLHLSPLILNQKLSIGLNN